jgi:hypothetical protein
MVSFGVRLRTLARLRVGVAVSFALACLAALSSVFRVNVVPPGLTRAAQPAGAHAQILVDDHKLSVLDAGFDYKSFGDLHEGAVLVASIIVQDPARDYIAQEARIPVTTIAFSDPQIPADSHVLQQQPPRKYSLTVAARPKVPIVDVYAQAPTLGEAQRLANASTSGASRYLAGPGNFGLQVVQLGHGGTVDTAAGGTLQTAIERFLGVLVLGCIATLLLARARRAWSVARRAAEVPS